MDEVRIAMPRSSRFRKPVRISANLEEDIYEWGKAHARRMGIEGGFGGLVTRLVVRLKRSTRHRRKSKIKPQPV